MKKLTLTITIAAVLTAVFLALAFPVSAAQPEPVRFELHTCSGPNHDWAVGPFEVYFGYDGDIDDYGTARGDIRVASGTLHGTWTLTGLSGDIVMRFNARVIPDSDTVDKVIGRFVIVSGTRDYVVLHGQGSIDGSLTLSGCEPLDSLDGTYSGVAHYVP